METARGIMEAMAADRKANPDIDVDVTESKLMKRLEAAQKKTRLPPELHRIIAAYAAHEHERIWRARPELWMISWGPGDWKTNPVAILQFISNNRGVWRSTDELLSNIMPMHADIMHFAGFGDFLRIGRERQRSIITRLMRDGHRHGLLDAKRADVYRKRKHFNTKTANIAADDTVGPAAERRRRNPTS